MAGDEPTAGNGRVPGERPPASESLSAASEPEPEPATLIYLDVDDEITSAAARIRLAAADRVAIVLPYGSRLATSRINFRLLAREAVERGKRIEVVGADPAARALAVAAGLPVHPSVAAFEGRGNDAAAAPGAASGATSGPAAGAVIGDAAAAEDDTQTRVLTAPRRTSPAVPRVGPPRPPIRTGLAIGVALAILVLVLVGGFLAVELLPSATIVLHPRSDEVGPLSLTVEARPDVVVPDAANLAIPATRYTFTVAATQTFAATGTKLVETKATGNVTFSNYDTGRSNRIDAGAIVETPSGIQFMTLAAVTLPSATIDFPFTIVPSTSTVAVEAVVAGPAGNVNNNTVTVVPKGENKNLLKVTNKEAMAGGEQRQATEVSQADLDAAVAAIDAALLADLDVQVASRTGIPDGVTTFPGTHAIGDAAYTVDPATLLGTEAAEFSLDASAEGSILGVDPGPIAGLVEDRLRSRVPPGWTLVDSSIEPVLGAPTVVGEIISFPVTITGTAIRDVDAAALAAEIKGLVLADARVRLEAYGDVEISLWPDWASTIPTRSDRISFTLGDPQPSAAPTP
jgi:hypothetical protein